MKYDPSSSAVPAAFITKFINLVTSSADALLRERLWAAKPMAAALCLVVVVGSAHAAPNVGMPFSGGTGRIGDPFRIESLTQLAYIAENLSEHNPVTDSDLAFCHFELIADIDGSDAGDSRTAFRGIGGSQNKFRGSLDGRGHTVRSLSILHPDWTALGGGGFFGWLKGAEVRNLHLEDLEVLGARNVGGLAGVTEKLNGISCKILNCSVSGTIEGNHTVGGLVGQLGEGSTILSCQVSGVVRGESYEIGGLVGVMGNDSEIASSESTCIVVSGGLDGNAIGGLVGRQRPGSTISSSRATGTVTGANQVGGLVGVVYKGDVTNCRASGATSGVDEVGGLVGYQHSGLYDTAIESCTALGSVNGSNSVGGLIGKQEDSKADTCRASGAVGGDSEIGGLVGRQDRGVVRSCFASGSVTALEGINIGGLVGIQATPGVGADGNGVYECSASGSIRGRENVGGLVGLQTTGYGQESVVIRSCASGDVTGKSCVGGAVGQQTNNGEIRDSFAMGTVSGIDKVGGLVGRQGPGGGNSVECTVRSSYACGRVSGDSAVGGLIGYQDSKKTTTSYSCYDQQTTGQSTGIGYQGGTGTVTGLTTAQFGVAKNFPSFSYAGYRSGFVFGDDSANPWIDPALTGSFGRPCLYWQLRTVMADPVDGARLVRGGTGSLVLSWPVTAGTSYEVWSCTDLRTGLWERWEELGVSPGNGDSRGVVEIAPNAGRRFFLVSEVEDPES